MIQLYARIEDIIPTEHNILKEPTSFHDPEEAILADNEMNCLKTFLASIKKTGIKYQMKLRPDGHIADGNCRYWCGRAGRMFHATHPYQAGFLPIDVKFFVGRYNPYDWRAKEPVLALRTQYPNTDHITYGTPNKYNFQGNPLFYDWRTERSKALKTVR